MSGSWGWIGVDLDGTLAHYDGWKGDDVIGAPIPEMVERVKAWLADGKDVRIFTARVGGVYTVDGEPRTSDYVALQIIRGWCLTHLGQSLPVTCQKDMRMVALYDDRCVQVQANTGRLIEDQQVVEADPSQDAATNKAQAILSVLVAIFQRLGIQLPEDSSWEYLWQKNGGVLRLAWMGRIEAERRDAEARRSRLGLVR